MMKIFRLITFVSAALFAHTIYAAQVLDRIAAIVDEDVITEVELNQRIQDISKQLRKPVTSEKDQQALRKQVLEKMIRDKIQLQLADKLGIKIDDVALNRTLDRLASANNITLESLRTTLESEGVKFDRFREQTRDELIMKQLQQRLVANKVNVSDQEIDQFIENNQKQAESNVRYNLRHILIGTPGSAKPEEIQQARSKAEDIYQRIQSGEDFASLAVQESTGRNALKGGELGWRAANELPESFVTALRSISTGQSTTPIRSASGFHLLYVSETSSQKSTVIQSLVRHILIDESDAEAASQKLADIRQRIVDGEDFASLAKQYSADPGSRDVGGELGWTDPGTFVPAFESTMQTLKTGVLSQPFKSQFGWHILEVMERRETTAGKKTLMAEARKQIRSRKVEEELRLWLRKIRDESYVEYLDRTTASN